MVHPALKLIILCCLLCAILIEVFGFSGPGDWSLIDSRECEKPEQYPTKFEVAKSKLNRTHDVLNMHLIIDSDITEDYDMRMEFCKQMDGGCKVMVNQDGKFCAFGREFFGNNWLMVLKGAGLDPPDCPVAKGEYWVKDFILNYDELPSTSMYGFWDATLWPIKDGVNIACVTFTFEFKPKDH